MSEHKCVRCGQTDPTKLTAGAPRCLSAFGCIDYLKEQRDRLAAALRKVSELGGKTLLGPDSKHHMGEAATRYHEMGAAAAFAQAAEIADAALREVPP